MLCHRVVTRRFRLVLFLFIALVKDCCFFLVYFQSCFCRLDTLLDSLIDENPAGIMDLSTPLFSESFEDDTKKFDIPTTDALVALDVPGRFELRY